LNAKWLKIGYFSLFISILLQLRRTTLKYAKWPEMAWFGDQIAPNLPQEIGR